MSLSKDIVPAVVLLDISERTVLSFDERFPPIPARSPRFTHCANGHLQVSEHPLPDLTQEHFFVLQPLVLCSIREPMNPVEIDKGQYTR